MQIFTALFDITSLMPHGYCLIWNSALLWLHVISDVLIVLSYYSIPFIILFYVRKHKDFPFDRLLLMLSAFIIACGTTHLVSIITIWIPLYWLEGLLKLLTGLLSVITAIRMYFIVPNVLAEMGRKRFLEEKLAIQASTMQDNLIKEVELRTKSLQLLTEQAQSDLQVKRIFLSNMSHEIRTPINAIISINYLALKTDLTEQQHNYLTKIDSSAKWLLGVLDDILNYSKLESGKLVLEHNDFELSLIITFLTDVASPLLKDKPVLLSFDIDPEVPAVLKGDSLRLEQVLLNLLTNAIKFTHEGSVTLKVELLNYEAQQARLRFSVLDTGIGLSLDQQSQLFKAFIQADNSTTRLYGGTGLGLAICEELVHAMGGSIIVESQVDVGSCFSFIINFEIPVLLPETEPLRLYQYPGLKNVKILVAEDNLVISEFIPDIMAYEGMLVDIARDGSEVLALLELNKYDAVLMDCQMPVMDGFETARRIRTDPRFDKLPIIAMTGNVFDQERERCFDNGMNDFISKPVAWDDAFLTLERWITDFEGQVKQQNTF